MPNVLQLNFKLNVTAEDYEQTVSTLGEAFANVEGLQWKIWMLNREAGEAGGIYLFRDASAVDAFLNSSLAAQVKAAPFLSALTAKRFDVMEELTAVTRGPVATTVTV
jgi:hypothetical protein